MATSDLSNHSSTNPAKQARWPLRSRLRTVVERLWLIARHPMLFVRYLGDRTVHRIRRLDPSRPLAVLEFDPRYRWGLNEYLYATVLFFAEAGYSVCYARRLGFRDYLQLRDARCDFGRWVYHLANVKVADSAPPEWPVALRVLDAAAPAPAHPGERTGTIDFDSLATYRAMRNVEPRSVFMPYPMYVPLYRLGQHRTLAARREAGRTVRAGFIGGADPAHYTRGGDMTATTGKIDRCRILDHIRQTCPKVRTPQSLAQLRALLEHMPADEFLLVTGVRVAAEEWLEVLSCFDFFLCPPGVRMPMCHNLIECLAVGSIPITNYADWLSPPLEHGVNALLFKDEQTLSDCIRSAMDMDARQIENLRHAAADYYDRHLSPQAFGAALRAIDGAGWTIRVNAERTTLLPSRKT